MKARDMTREEIYKKTKVFEALTALYTTVSGNKVELVGWTWALAKDGNYERFFKDSNEVADFMATEIKAHVEKMREEVQV